MKYLVVEPFTIGTPQGTLTLPTGKVLELSQDQAERLGSKICLAAEGNKHLPHYCTTGDCWCSTKLTGRDYPAGCIRIKCEYHGTNPVAQGMSPQQPDTAAEGELSQ